MQEDAMTRLRHGDWDSNLRWMVVIGSMAILVLGFFILGPDGLPG